ncbi:hypothetical protein [Pseudomonas sp. FEN]|nr:hypothetical protein [Pseudomonas sp. FEN]
MRSPFFTAWHGHIPLLGMAAILLTGCSTWITHQPAQPHLARINP